MLTIINKLFRMQISIWIGDNKMNNKKLNQHETGRSMVEMLGVLAVVGLLSVMAFAGFKIALNKAKANAIIHDGRMVWAEALAWQTVPTRNDWIDSQAANESGKSFAVWRDIKDNNYIKVEGVEEEVCEQMLPHQHEGSLLFLTTSFEDLTTCPEGENVIVMAFDGVSGKPAECENQKGCQDLYSDAFYCDGDGHCQECDENLSYVNAAGDGCECNSAVALTCDDGAGHTWCCGQDEYGKERICGTTPGECTVSNLKCHYYLTLLNKPIKKYTNCSYYIGRSIINNIEEGYIEPKNTNQCARGEYCYIAYEDELCEDPAEATDEGWLQGTCIKETVVSTTCNIDLSEDDFEFTVKTGCPVNKYCYLKWTDSLCETALVGSDTGDLYGTCIGYSTTNPDSCPTNNN